MKRTATQRVSGRGGVPEFAPGSGRARGGRVANQPFSADVVPAKLWPVERFPGQTSKKSETRDHRNKALGTTRRRTQRGRSRLNCAGHLP